ncbi:MAG: hypothetical protein ACLFS3_00900 [Candidatus Aenigmatarchaeota archaeon]
MTDEVTGDYSDFFDRIETVHEELQNWNEDSLEKHVKNYPENVGSILLARPLTEYVMENGKQEAEEVKRMCKQAVEDLDLRDEYSEEVLQEGWQRIKENRNLYVEERVPSVDYEEVRRTRKFASGLSTKRRARNI